MPLHVVYARRRPPLPHLCHTSAIPPRLLLILGVSSPSHSRLYTLASALLQCPAIRERSNDHLCVSSNELK